MMSENAVRLLMTNTVEEETNREWQILLERAATGDVDAFEQVMRRTERSVLSIARRMLGNPSDAEEASQEVYIRVFKYLHRFNRTKRFEPWLYRLTINVCNDIAAQRPRTADVEQIDERFAGTSSDPDASLDLDERRQLLQTALDQLPAKQRAAVVLREIQGMSTTEVAAIMQVREATVRSHLNAARIRIKQLIERILSRRRRP